MDNVIDLNKEQEKQEKVQDKPVTLDDLKEIESVLEGIVDEADILANLGGLLSMPEDTFEILAPGILQAFLQSINNPNDKIALVQALNATGQTSEDLIEAFDALTGALDEIKEISTQKKDFIKQLVGGLVTVISETEGISKRLVQIPIELCHEDAKLPQYANTTDSGLDLFALDDYTINPGETKLIPTGIKVALPPGYEFQVRPKSGRALRTKLRVANSPGTIDAGYRDEIKVIIENIESPIKDIKYHFDDSGEEVKIVIDSIEHGAAHTISKGEKFAQLVLVEVPKAALFKVEKVLGIGENRGGGFGSSGLK